MKLSPLDIKKQDFARTLRGYDVEEVQAFLDMLAGQWEELRADQRRAEDKIVELKAKLEHYERVEEALQEALQTARQNSQQALENAKQEASLVLQKAKADAEELTRASIQERDQVQQEIEEITGRRDELVAQLRAFLSSELELLARFGGGNLLSAGWHPTSTRREPRESAEDQEAKAVAAALIAETPEQEEDDAFPDLLAELPGIPEVSPELAQAAKDLAQEDRISASSEIDEAVASEDEAVEDEAASDVVAEAVAVEEVAAEEGVVPEDQAATDEEVTLDFEGLDEVLEDVEEESQAQPEAPPAEGVADDTPEEIEDQSVEAEPVVAAEWEEETPPDEPVAEAEAEEEVPQEEAETEPVAEDPAVEEPVVEEPVAEESPPVLPEITLDSVEDVVKAPQEIVVEVPPEMEIAPIEMVADDLPEIEAEPMEAVVEVPPEMEIAPIEMVADDLPEIEVESIVMEASEEQPAEALPADSVEEETEAFAAGPTEPFYQDEEVLSFKFFEPQDESSLPAKFFQEDEEPSQFGPDQKGARKKEHASNLNRFDDRSPADSTWIVRPVASSSQPPVSESVSEEGFIASEEEIEKIRRILSDLD
ncbi:MAG: DivIVA domain-containing protein [Rhodothermales bacterium]